ncbi:hypothetical protein OPV22_015479 [Ensete ventricosum]|uniref:SHSP domain-containing protein n=1 Tax=Ensete ventricosum TaxID=4639 RepID=A0AAV8R5M9_ENSVE|nr:hypothetical protein OPV22_015479 [Ensete ventricosum]
MALELDLSVTGTTRNLAFASAETEAVFVLLAHLPGLVREKIEVSVNEEGTEIRISGGGDKSAVETVVGRRLRLRNEFQINPFQKVFRIPSGVALDQIDAGFYEEGDILVILMPKSVRGSAAGIAIGEVQEEGEAPREQKIEGDEVISMDRPRDHAEAIQNRTAIDDAKAPKAEEEEEEEETKQGKEEDLIRREGAEEKLDQIGVESSETDRNGDREPKHMGAEMKTPKEKELEEEERRKVPDRPQKPLIEMEAPDLHGEPPPSAAPTPTNGAEQEDTIEKTSGPHREEDEDEVPESLEAPEADRDLHQPKGQQTYPDHQTEQEDKAHEPERQEDRAVPESFEAAQSEGDIHQPEEQLTDPHHRTEQENQAPEPIEAPKPDGEDIHHPEDKTKPGEVSDQIPRRSGDKAEEAADQGPEADKPVEAPDEDEGDESSPDNAGARERENGPKGKRKRTERAKGGGGGAPPPTLAVFAFMLSLVALAVQVVKSRRRR